MASQDEHDEPQRITEPATPPQPPPVPKFDPDATPAERLVVAVVFLEQLERWPGVTAEDRSEARAVVAERLACLDAGAGRSLSAYMDQLRGTVHL